jgi:hypothetical protein
LKQKNKKIQKIYLTLPKWNSRIIVESEGIMWIRAYSCDACDNTFVTNPIPANHTKLCSSCAEIDKEYAMQYDEILRGREDSYEAR